MTDNVQAGAQSGAGPIFSSEDIGAGVQVPVFKPAFGAHGAATPVDDANGKRLPVKVGDPLPAGSNVIGKTAPAGGNVADHSGSAPAVGNVLSTIDPNAARIGAFVQNQSANPLQVALDDGGAGTPVIIILAPAPSDGGQGGYWSTAGFLHTGRIRVCGTAGSQFAAAEI